MENLIDKFNIFYQQNKHIFLAAFFMFVVAVVVIAFAWFWQSVGARTERAFAAAEKYHLIETCRNEGAHAFEHLETGTILCSRGSLRAQK
jgi:hypothetical protein